MKTALTLADLLRSADHRHEVGAGRLETVDGAVRLIVPATDATHYHNAQLDDYHTLPRKNFAWRPPLVLHVRARFSHGVDALRGTAGFGFWNDPFMMTTRRPPALPRALWFFFASRPSNMALAKGVPGKGWKAATIDAQRAAFLALLPAAPIGFLLMRSPQLYGKLWPVAQRALGVDEAVIDVGLQGWHDYVLEWRAQEAVFRVDDRVVLRAPAPAGPLGLVVWLDNQTMVVTPQGRFAHHVLARETDQWLELSALTVRMGNRPRKKPDAADLS
jgi:hypothetical protein